MFGTGPSIMTQRLRTQDIGLAGAAVAPWRSAVGMIMLANPWISGNKIVTQLRIQKSSWPDLRASLEMRHYITCDRNDNGHVIRMSVTEHGANRLASKQAETS
jgi:hypothetical protein